jgi:hypothetical protein
MAFCPWLVSQETRRRPMSRMEAFMRLCEVKHVRWCEHGFFFLFFSLLLHLFGYDMYSPMSVGRGGLALVSCRVSFQGFQDSTDPLQCCLKVARTPHSLSPCVGVDCAIFHQPPLPCTSPLPNRMELAPQYASWTWWFKKGKSLAIARSAMGAATSWNSCIA